MNDGRRWAQILGLCAALGATSPGWAQASPAGQAGTPPAAAPAVSDKPAVPAGAAGKSAIPTPARAQALEPSAPADLGVNLPKFRSGLWEYKRTMTTGRGRVAPQTTTVRKCSDPSREFEEKMAHLKQRGCRFSPLVRHGDEYHSNWNCPGTDGLIIFDDVLTAANELSYQDRSEIRYMPQSSRTSTSTITATWLGSCPIVGRPTASY